MRLPHLLLTLATLGVAVCGSILGAAQVSAAPRSAKQDLTPQTLADLHALVRPHDNEWRHLRVDWVTDVVAARKRAAAEDKPIVILYTGGAGYNEPLGTC